MHNPPNIVEFAFALAQAPGIEGPTRPWLATLRAFDGLSLSDDDVSILAAVTGRSRKAIRAHEEQPYPELWARVGRRGRKSATAAMITDHQALYGGHERYLMPHELGMIVTISKDLSGADLIKRFQHLFLDALGIQYHETKFGAVTVTLIEGCQIALACLTCTAEAPRGPAIPVAILDEPAFWDVSERYADPDVEIIGALRPAMAQFPNRKLIAISSPFGIEGVFHKTIEAALGNDNEQSILAVQGPTWEWSPTITEERTHELERIESVWSREYAAIPSATLSNSYFDPSSIERAFDRKIPPWFIKRPNSAAHVCLDGSAGHEGGDGFAWAVFQYYEEDPLEIFVQVGNGEHQRAQTSLVTGEKIRRHDRPRIEPILCCEFLDVLNAPFFETWPPSKIVKRIIADGQRYNAPGARIYCHLDQFADAALAELIRNEQGKALYHPWSAPVKFKAASLVRSWLDNDNLAINPNAPGAAQLKRELGTFCETLQNSGNVKLEARRGYHDDMVSVLLMAAVAAQVGYGPEKLGWMAARGVIQ